MKPFVLVLLTVVTATAQSVSSGSWNAHGAAGPAAASVTVTSIAVSPASPTQYVGSAVQFTATCTYSDNSSADCTSNSTWSSSSPTVMSLSSPVTNPESGTCLTAGTSTITAFAGAVSGHVTGTCQALATSMVSLPTAWVNNHQCDATLTSPNQTINYPASGTGGTWVGGGPYTANSAGSLNQAIADAEAYRQGHLTSGKVLINIPAGSVFTSSGHTVSLPQTAGDTSTNCIALVSTGTLPAGVTVCSHGTQDPISESSNPGTRDPSCTTSNDVAQMFTVETSGSAGGGTAINTAAPDANGVGPHHFLIIGAEFREASADTSNLTYLVLLGDPNYADTAASAEPSAIFIDRSWFHSYCLDNRTGCTPGILHTLVPDCGGQGCSVTNSQFSQNIYGGQQSQYIFIPNSAGPLKIVHNWIDGAAQAIICGGTSTSLGSPYQSCNDVEIRRNYMTYPAGWMGSANDFKPNNQSPNRIAVIEFKSSARVLIDGNILENVDDTGAQYHGFGFNPRAYNNQQAQYYVNVRDMTFTNNIIRHVCRSSAAEIATRSNNPPNGNGTSMPTVYHNISNNLLYDYDKPSFCGTADGNGQGFAWNDGFTALTCSAQRDSAGLTSTLTCTNGGVGQAQTDTNVGDYVVVTSCSDSSFNVGASSTVHGPPALAGTDPNGLTVVYSNAGTANATATGCQFLNHQGFTQYQVVSHNTFILSSGSAGWNIFLGGGIGNGTMFMRNNKITDNIILGQGVRGQGLSDSSTPTSQAANWDTASLEWHHMIYTGRSCSNYFDELTAGGPQIKPPTTSFCPSTPYCTTNDPTSGSCVGFSGEMSAASLNTNLSDWHGYKLCHTGDASCAHPSLYAAGQSNQASDGQDIGVIFPNIDAAQTQTEYVCTSACGAGPSPD